MIFNLTKAYITVIECVLCIGAKSMIIYLHIYFGLSAALKSENIVTTYEKSVQEIPVVCQIVCTG